MYFLLDRGRVQFGQLFVSLCKTLPDRFYLQLEENVIVIGERVTDRLTDRKTERTEEKNQSGNPIKPQEWKNPMKDNVVE